MKMHVLTVTTLYPNREQIRNGIFVRERLQRLVESRSDVQVTVIAPVPWFPFKSRSFGRYAVFARVPSEQQDGRIRVLHPRYLQIPKMGEWLAPLAYFAAVSRSVRRHGLRDIDLVDAHFAFPDGVGAVLLARKLGKPVSITVRGSDVNVIAEEPVAGRWIRWALQRADTVIAVSAALAERVRQIIDSSRPAAPSVEVIRNGVDMARFAPADDPMQVRRDLGLEGERVIVSVGNLIPLKGHDLVIRAVAQMPGSEAVIIGSGPERAALQSLCRSLDVDDRVRFCGEMTQEDLARYYQAADVTVLASSNEGLPNVILESMACGTPVVVTRVGGVPEVMTDQVMGIVIDQRTPEAVRRAVMRLPPGKDPCLAARVRQSVLGFDWSATVTNLQRAFAGMSRSDDNGGVL